MMSVIAQKPGWPKINQVREWHRALGVSSIRRDEPQGSPRLVQRLDDFEHGRLDTGLGAPVAPVAVESAALPAVSPAADEPHVLPAEAGQFAALQAETGPLEYKYINRKQATQSQKRICARKGGTLPRYSLFVHDADLAREMPFAKFKAEHCKSVSEAAGQARVSASISWLVWRSHVPTRWLRFEVIAVLGRAGESR